MRFGLRRASGLAALLLLILPWRPPEPLDSRQDGEREGEAHHENPKAAFLIRLEWELEDLKESQRHTLDGAVLPRGQASSGVFGTQSETSIAVSGSNVVVGFNQVNGTRGSGVAYSTDGGSTFTDPGGLPTGGGTNRLFGDPSVTACADGTFYYASIFAPDSFFSLSQVAVNVGTFSGPTLSWTNPIVAVSSANDFLDKSWITCDRITNTLYATYTRFVNGNVGSTTELRVELIKSVDGGLHWSVPVVLDSTTTESIHVCYVATGPNGEVYTIWERGLDDIAAATTKIEFRRSLNGGASFEPKVTIRTLPPSFFPAPVGFNREDTIELGTLAVDLSNGARRGNLYAVWVEREAAGGEQRDVFMATSTNQGGSWTAPVKVNDDSPGNDQVMPWVSVNGQGVVEPVWYDYRNWRGMHTVDLYSARSTDGGATFAANYRITTAPTTWFVPLTLTPNFGDYIGSTSQGSDFYPAWADGRRGDIDAYAAHVPTGTCGNGSLDPFEECDDGNLVDEDSCSPACAVTLCGNGQIDAGEACDDGNHRSGDGCSQVCVQEVCGDGVIQKSNGEECDDGNILPGDGCNASCQLELDKMAWLADERSRLVVMNIQNGLSMTIGDPGFHELGDLAFDAAGNLFGSTGFNAGLSIGFNGYLVSMAPLGLPDRGGVVGSTGWLAVTAIDFHPATGTLYGIAVDGSSVSRLVTLNPATGATLSVLGDLGLIAAGAMAFDASGTLYVAGKTTASNVGHGLYTVSLSPFSKTLVGQIGYAVSGMDFAPDGTLYGVIKRRLSASEPEPANNGGVIQISQATGAGTLLYLDGYLNQQGIRFAPAIAVDHDLDGIRDVVDCAPQSAANPAPGLTTGLAFSAGSNFSWTAAPNSRFSNSYRGTITGPLAARLPGSVYNHVCFESGDFQANGPHLSSDPSTPPLDTVYYYLSDGEGCGEGALDSDAAHPIPNPNPCPTPP